MSLEWDFSTLADRLIGVIADADGQVRQEQAVYGLDSLDESGIQALLANGLSSFFQVHREVHYPSTAGRRLTHRPRCDLALTRRGRPLRLDHKPPGLFDPVDTAGPEEALWVEIKVAHQYREGGVRHHGYGAQWRQAIVSDVKKMEAEALIRHACLVVVVFNESQPILDKDLELFEQVLAQKEVLAGFRQVRSHRIQDRIGHHLASIALWPTLQR